VCDDETRKRLIELREKIATTGMPCLFFCKADCSRLGSALESSSEGGGWLSLEYCNHESGKETSRLGVGCSVWLGARFATPPMTVDSFRRTTQDC